MLNLMRHIPKIPGGPSRVTGTQVGVEAACATPPWRLLRSIGAVADVRCVQKPPGGRQTAATVQTLTTIKARSRSLLVNLDGTCQSFSASEVTFALNGGLRSLRGCFVPAPSASTGLGRDLPLFAACPNLKDHLSFPVAHIRPGRKSAICGKKYSMTMASRYMRKNGNIPLTS